MSFKLYVLVALTLALPLSAPALAQDPTAVEASVTVNFSDLNVDTIAGAAELLTRIRGAARTVCSRDINNRAVPDLCIRESTERALAQINRPVLTALYKGNVSIKVAQGD
jgi:UrcA family protein